MHDHVGAVIDLLGGFDDLGAGGGIGLVVESAADPGVLLHENRMTMALHDLDAGRRHGYAIFLGLDLLENSYNHVNLL